jgi:excisionase family DNA binding protein
MSHDVTPKPPIRLRTRSIPADPFATTRLLTATDVAGVLQVSVRTVRRLIAAGSLEAIQVGRSVRIAPEALQAMLGSKGQTGT